MPRAAQSEVANAAESAAFCTSIFCLTAWPALPTSVINTTITSKTINATKAIFPRRGSARAASRTGRCRDPVPPVESLPSSIADPQRLRIVLRTFVGQPDACRQWKGVPVAVRFADQTSDSRNSEGVVVGDFRD